MSIFSSVWNVFLFKESGWPGAHTSNPITREIDAREPLLLRPTYAP